MIKVIKIGFDKGSGQERKICFDRGSEPDAPTPPPARPTVFTFVKECQLPSSSVNVCFTKIFVSASLVTFILSNDIWPRFQLFLICGRNVEEIPRKEL